MGFNLPSAHKLHTFYKASYAVDWITLILLLIASIIPLITRPFYRQFSITDLRIAHPFAEKERVPVPELILYAVAIPVVIIAAGASLYPGNYSRHGRGKHHKLHVSMLAFFTGLFITTFLTDIVKNAVGRPRPDLLDRCQAKAGTPGDILVDYTVCTQKNRHRLDDGFRSFPSGHSSMAFMGLGFLSWWLAGQLGSARKGAGLPAIILAAIPMICALLIAISRTEDYRHDVYDVTVGSLIGLIISLWSYRRFFPPLKSPKSHEPYGSRLPEEEDDDGGGYDGKGRFEMLSEGERLPMHRGDLEMGGER